LAVANAFFGRHSSFWRLSTSSQQAWNWSSQTPLITPCVTSSKAQHLRMAILSFVWTPAPKLDFSTLPMLSPPLTAEIFTKSLANSLLLTLASTGLGSLWLKLLSKSTVEMPMSTFTLLKSQQERSEANLFLLSHLHLPRPLSLWLSSWPLLCWLHKVFCYPLHTDALKKNLLKSTILENPLLSCFFLCLIRYYINVSCPRRGKLYTRRVPCLRAPPPPPHPPFFVLNPPSY
jgi:hypothetical protein